MKKVNELYAIIKQTDYGEITTREECSGYFDIETGEDIYETVWYRPYDPHEEFVKAFSNEDEAKEEYKKLVDEYINSHQWPFNDPHFEYNGSGDIITEFTDGDDSECYILRKYKQ